jgi:hypothetical protein
MKNVMTESAHQTLRAYEFIQDLSYKVKNLTRTDKSTLNMMKIHD